MPKIRSIRRPGDGGRERYDERIRKPLPVAARLAATLVVAFCVLTATGLSADLRTGKPIPVVEARTLDQAAAPTFALDEETEAIRQEYYVYRERFDQIGTMEDISESGYEIVEKHVFDISVVMVTVPEEDPASSGQGAASGQSPAGDSSRPGQAGLSQGGQADAGLIPTKQVIQVTRPEQALTIDEADPVALQEYPTVRFFSAIDHVTHRAAVFLADGEGRIVYKTDQLECNFTERGRLEQPIVDIISVAFSDVNRDGWTDIILIAGCEKRGGENAGMIYKVGEVLFQKGQGESVPEETIPEVDLERLWFYRDWRVNDKLNRFNMNKNARSIICFVRDGISTEFLYTATTKQELLENGLQIISAQNYWRSYEKLGTLEVVPGHFRMADYDVFLIYLINTQGNIVWTFQPMGDYDNLYSLKGMRSSSDIDGDGMKDLVVLARYSKETEDGQMQVDTRCAIYYQRTGGFVTDHDFVDGYVCSPKETMTELIAAARAYWNWQEEELAND